MPAHRTVAPILDTTLKVARRDTLDMMLLLPFGPFGLSLNARHSANFEK
jgi:hypothetical protein